MSPVFIPKGQVASYEATFEVSAAPELSVRARVRNSGRLDAGVRLIPDEVTACYAFHEGRWLSSGIEIRGFTSDRVTPLVVRFTPDNQFDPP